MVNFRSICKNQLIIRVISDLKLNFKLMLSTLFSQLIIFIDNLINFLVASINQLNDFVTKKKNFSFS